MSSDIKHFNVIEFDELTRFITAITKAIFSRFPITTFFDSATAISKSDRIVGIKSAF